MNPIIFPLIIFTPTCQTHVPTETVFPAHCLPLLHPTPPVPFECERERQARVSIFQRALIEVSAKRWVAQTSRSFSCVQPGCCLRKTGPFSSRGCPWPEENSRKSERHRGEGHGRMFSSASFPFGERSVGWGPLHAVHFAPVRNVIKCAATTTTVTIAAVVILIRLLRSFTPCPVPLVSTSFEGDRGWVGVVGINFNSLMAR